MNKHPLSLLIFAKGFFLIILETFLVANSFASEPSGMRFNTKLLYGLYPSLDYIIYNGQFVKHISYFSLETNYRWNKFFEAGAYLGISRYKDLVYDNPEEFAVLSPVYRPLLFYGINANLKPLPLIIKRDDFWIDPYISAKLGSFFFVNSGVAIKDYRDHFDYGIYGGLALYPGKHWGFFGEYGFGNFLDWRTGISFRF